MDAPARDTIAAIASAPGAGRRGVVRLSGPAAGAVVAASFRSGAGEPFDPRTPRGAYAGRLDDGAGTQPCLLLWMPGPRSYTREDVAELHLPGSPPLLDAALRRVLALGARPAEPGEFTRRAFESGRLDLTRAEGVLELVRARTEDERRAASALLAGGLDERLAALRERLEALRALCEASLDFDETDTGHVPDEELAARAADVAGRLAEALRWEERRAPPAGQPRVVLFGAPNAGKSALFNALAAGGRALVAELAGTTRDGVAGEARLADFALRLLDAPGLEPGSADPDRRAQVLARAERESADLVLWVADAAAATPESLEAQASALPAGVPRVLAWSKADLRAARPLPPPARLAELGVADARAVSALAATGLDELRAALARALGLAEGAGESGDDSAGSRGGASGAGGRGGGRAGRTDAAPAPPAGRGRELSRRHRDALARAAAEVARAREALGTGEPLDLVAQTLRGATDALDAIGGRTTPEDLLERIFASFCIGK